VHGTTPIGGELFDPIQYYQHSASIGRMIGAALMIAGVSLIAKS